jgi:hypothetical protein
MTAYDIGLSFAGENRTYVRSVAACLREQGIRVFFDEYDTANLWGKDLYQHLSSVYRSVKYCVVFISEPYAAKLWTRHELRAAQARAYQAEQEFILPARFDDTELPGVLPTTMYIDLRGLPPEALADLIVEKFQAQGVSTKPTLNVGTLKSKMKTDARPPFAPWRNLKRLHSIRYRVTEPLDAVERYHSVVEHLAGTGRWSFDHVVVYPQELIGAEDSLERELRKFIKDVNGAVQEVGAMLSSYVPHFDKIGIPIRMFHEITMALIKAAVATEFLLELAAPIREGVTMQRLREDVLYATARESLNEVVDRIRDARASEDANGLTIS